MLKYTILGKIQKTKQKKNQQQQKQQQQRKKERKKETKHTHTKFLLWNQVYKPGQAVFVWVELYFVLNSRAIFDNQVYSV